MSSNQVGVSTSHEIVQKITRIKTVYIRATHQTGEYTELKDIANQLARIFYNQPNYDSCLGKAQNIYKKDKGFDNKVFIIIWPKRNIFKAKCLNNSKRQNVLSNSAKINNFKCAKLRDNIRNMINHILNHNIDIS